ncbi:hypothetical protein JIQ42_01108 [Leishmania sp. Namibia]|uniref:hypothetical protein n=1 Tax=Leishmania sp. Namibia TaxID=2802991 RepID=UPI001B7B5073|nr:hypothetical protein JIQ42_01108 [Leishmania sp. Namibia]
MATEGGEEEWADGVDDFFAEFSLAALQDKSTRRKNAEVYQASVAQSKKKLELKEADRSESAEEARRRITAAVMSRATAKEIERAVQNAKKHQKTTQAKSSTDPTPLNLGLSSSLPEQPHGSPAPASSSPSLTGHDSTTHRFHAESSSSRFCKKRQRVDSKFARKAARKERAKEHRRK